MGAGTDVVWRLYERLQARDARGMAELMSDNVVIYGPGCTAFGGIHEGKRGFLAYSAKVQEMTGGELEVTVHRVIGDEEQVVAFLTVRATRAGRSTSWNQLTAVQVYEGLITEIWQLPDSSHSFDEFWS